MSRINPEVLRREREGKGWSLADLARRCGIDAQSIHRIEKGGIKRNRRSVMVALAKALGISEDVLTGNLTPATDKDLGSIDSKTSSGAESESARSARELDKADVLLSISQLNVRVSNRSRNALALVSLRYGVTQAQILEIAPLLFCLAAERSLQERQRRLDDIQEASGKLENLICSHLHGRAFYNTQSYEIFDAERRSIAANDIFGKLVTGDRLESYLPRDYYEPADNPFAAFLLAQTEIIPDRASFDEWDPDWSPKYSVCKNEAVAFVAGDEDAATDVLDGTAALHRLPKELRGAERGRDRAEWARSEVERYIKESGIDFEKLNLDIGEHDDETP